MAFPDLLFGRRRRSSPPSFRPTLEALEPRRVPSTTPFVEVHPGQSIQAAVDAATPGTTIVLDPGTYRQSVTVPKPGITLEGKGSRGSVVLESPGGVPNGITVNPGGDGFSLLNITVQGFSANGVYLSGIQRFLLAGVTANNDGGYGIFPSQVAGGLVLGCSAGGNNDTGIYVGQSVNVAAVGNTVHDNVNGLEAENSVNVMLAGNVSYHNTVGILVDLLPDLAVTTGSNILVTGNLVAANNHANFGSPGDITALESGGVGIFVLGTTRTDVADNLVLGNQLIGVGVTSSYLLTLLGGVSVSDIQPLSVGVRVHNNTVLGAPFGTDLLWDGLGVGDSWSGNLFQTSFSLRPFPGP
jgi:parallel beta-helix repeat protein